MIGAGICARPYKEENTVAIDESTLTKGQLRKLNALRKSVGAKLGEKCSASGSRNRRRRRSRIRSRVKIEEAMAGFADDRTFRLGNYGYTIRRARGKASQDSWRRRMRNHCDGQVNGELVYPSRNHRGATARRFGVNWKEVLSMAQQIRRQLAYAAYDPKLSAIGRRTRW